MFTRAEFFKGWGPEIPRDFTVAVILLASAFLLLSPIFSVGLLCDDMQYHLASRGEGLGWDAFWQIQGSKNRPLTSWVLAIVLDDGSYPSWAPGFIRIFHHFINSCLIFAVARKKMKVPGFQAWLPALAFLVLPTNAEIFWQSALHDVAALTFVLLALLWIKDQAGKADFSLFCAFAFLAYLCKESAWCLPLVLWVLAKNFHPSILVKYSLAAVAVFVLYFSLRWWWLGSLWGDLGPYIADPVGALTLTKNFLKFIARLFTPSWINFKALNFSTLAAAGFFSAFWLWVFLAAKKVNSKASVVFLVVLLFSLGPVLRLSLSIQNSENFRYLYLPGAFLCLFFVLAAKKLNERILPRAYFGCFILASALSLYYVGTLWRHATQEALIYQRAVQDFAGRNPALEKVWVLCAPDNYEGAFSARNMSWGFFVLANPHVREVNVLATQYLGENWPRGCEFSLGNKNQWLVRSAEAQLANPEFNIGKRELYSGPLRLTASAFSNDRTDSLQITSDRDLAANEALLIFDGQHLIAATNKSVN